MKNYFYLTAGILATSLCACATTNSIKDMDEHRTIERQRRYEHSILNKDIRNMKEQMDKEKERRCKHAVLSQFADITDMIEHREVVRRTRECEE